jgi:hypothetical protein
MNNKSENKNNVEEILNSLDHIQRATPRPFFYTRLMAKLDRQSSQWEKVISFITKPAFAIAVIVLFLFLNIVILYNSSPKTTTTPQDDSSLAIENDYGLSVPSLYDINPDQNEIAQK